MSLEEHRNIHVSDHRYRKNKTQILMRQRLLHTIYAAGQETEGRGYWGINNGIKAIDKEEIISLSGPCYLQCGQSLKQYMHHLEAC